MCRAKAHVAGTPITAPIAIDHKVGITGNPIHVPISDAKNTFVAIAPAPNG